MTKENLSAYISTDCIPLDHGNFRFPTAAWPNYFLTMINVNKDRLSSMVSTSFICQVITLQEATWPRMRLSDLANQSRIGRALATNNWPAGSPLIWHGYFHQIVFSINKSESVESWELDTKPLIVCDTQNIPVKCHLRYLWQRRQLTLKSVK